jgi:hypothetical protein
MNAIEELLKECKELNPDTFSGNLLAQAIHEFDEFVNFTVCAYCGHKSPTQDKTAVLDHILTCDKRPEKKLLEKAFEVEDRLYQRIIHLTENGYKPDNCDACKEIKEVLHIYLEPNEYQPTQETFQDAVRNDPDMTAEQKAYWLSFPPAGANPIDE